MRIKSNILSKSSNLILAWMAGLIIMWPSGEGVYHLDKDIKSVQIQADIEDVSWPEITSQQKAWTRWWWMGNAVTKEGITYHLEKMAEANFGGVEISPIYGVEGYEVNSVLYLSEEWMALLFHTVEEAERLGMQVDMITGTGWPFGGSHVSTEDAARRLVISTYQLQGGEQLDHQVIQVNRRNAARAPLHVLMGYSSEGETMDLTTYVNEQGHLDWIPEEGSGRWQLIAFFNDWTNQQVKRAAPGAEGHVMDHFSDNALENYLERYDRAFEPFDDGLLRAFFNDSYEVERANWTYDFFDQFQNYRNYDLKEYLPEFLGRYRSGFSGPELGISDREMTQRIRADFHETIHDLALNRFVKPWVEWTHSKGSISRNQAHGFPANILDIYGAADIPEMEIFGQARFRIPGLRTNPDVSHRIDSPNPLVLKFASSAAHVEGRDLASSETATWLDEHFMVSLSQLRPHVDMQFISGINHTVYHGMTYSPQEEKWPGWKFYASTHFSPVNTYWDDLGDFNRYMANSQAFLQDGTPGNDILLYFPVHDLWHSDTSPAGTPYFIRYHNPDEWLYGTEMGNTAEILWERGYTFDYISDSQLQRTTSDNGILLTGNAQYQTILVPRVDYIPVETIRQLMTLAGDGATVIFKGQLPHDVPGLHNLTERRDELSELYDSLQFEPVGTHGIYRAAIGSGEILKGDNSHDLLGVTGVHREQVKDKAVDFIRRKHENGYTYFLSNLHGEAVNSWVELGTEAESVMIYNPYTEKSGLADTRMGREGKTEIYLQIRPGESIVLKTFDTSLTDIESWQYFQVSGQPHPVQGTWQVQFTEGGPVTPGDIEMNELISWTETGDSDAARFAGSAVYSISFDLPATEADGWRLDLGRVAESAEVRLNGEVVSTVWGHPFEIDIDGDLLQSSNNQLEIRVTNLMINRVIDLDRRGVRWQKFYDINMVNINYEPFDASGWDPMESGLLGPVTITPLSFNN
jgi:hypothetical protein